MPQAAAHRLGETERQQSEGREEQLLAVVGADPRVDGVPDHERPLNRPVQMDRRRPDRVRRAEAAEHDRCDGDRRQCSAP